MHDPEIVHGELNRSSGYMESWLRHYFVERKTTEWEP
jgi:hypothetical protein